MSQSSPRSKLSSVLIVAEYGVLNGGERSLLAILPHLMKKEWAFKALIPTHSEFDRALRNLGIPTMPFSKQDVSGKRLTQQQIRERLKAQLIDFEPTIVHCNSLSTSRFCGPVTCELEIPALGYLRDILRLSKQAINDINQLDVIVAVSHATRRWHIEQGMDPQRIEVVYNGVDLERFFPLPSRFDRSIRTELGMELDDPIVLFVGQIGVRKGVDLLIESFTRIANQHPNCHLLIVGERNSTKQEAVEFENHIHKMVRQADNSSQVATCPASPVAPRVHWLGRRTDVAEIMRQSTIVIHPARQEPLGRVLLEAAACGLPIITTNVGGSAEILADLELFDLIQPLDVDAISHRALQLLDNNRQRQEISKQLRLVAETRFADHDSAAKIDGCYRRMVPGHNSGE